MIKLLEIENFKSLKKESFDFGKLNIITGVNSAGKSSVLQTLLLMADALDEIRAQNEKFSIGLQEKFAFEDNLLKTIKQLIESGKAVSNSEQLIQELNRQAERLDKMKLMATEYYSSTKSFPNQKLRNWKFETIRNRRENAKNVIISLNGTICSMNADSCSLKNSNLEFEKNVDFFYLSENRSGPENKEILIESDVFGDYAEYAMGYLYRHQNDVISASMSMTESMTLSGNVDYWMSEILKSDENDFSIGLKVEKIDSESVKPYYDFCGLPNIEPLQLGAGVSYLAKLLIICLCAKPGQIVIVENPEMHLHPRAQSAVGHFLSFIASKGIQVIIETHCEHLINKVQHDVFKGLLKPEDVFIYYKKSSIDDFEKMTIGRNGHFLQDGKRCRFPAGFFDATLTELLEIG